MLLERLPSPGSPGEKGATRQDIPQKQLGASLAHADPLCAFNRRVVAIVHDEKPGLDAQREAVQS
jgi:hypothetical protein